MIKRVLKSTIVMSVVATTIFAGQGVMFNVIDGNAETKYNTLINKKIGQIGFVLSDPNGRINDAYAKKYGSNKQDPLYDKEYKKNLDNLGFFTIAQDEKLRELLIKAPSLGAFSPFNLLVYKNANENKTYVGHIMPNTMLDIAGIKDAQIRKDFIATFPALDKLVQKELGGKVTITEFESLPKKPMMNFEIKFDRPADLSEFIDEFQEKFEAAFEAKQYIIAGYKDFKSAYTENGKNFDKFDAYWVYSLCHFTFSYNMFNKGRPDAGVFAPCSMYMYIEKDSNTIVVGMPKLANWSAVLNLKNPKMIKDIKRLDAEIFELMKSIGAKEI